MRRPGGSCYGYEPHLFTGPWQLYLPYTNKLTVISAASSVQRLQDDGPSYFRYFRRNTFGNHRHASRSRRFRHEVPGTTEKSSQNTKRPSTHLVISRKESIIESLTSDRLLTGMVAGLVPGDSPLRPASRTRGGGGRSSLRTCGPKQHTTTTACKVTTTTPTPCIGYTRSNTTHYSRGTTPAGVMGARGGRGQRDWVRGGG